MNFAKFVLIFSCLVLCSCVNNGRRDEAYNGYESYQQPNVTAYAAPVAVQQPVVYAVPAVPPAPVVQPEPVAQAEPVANPYALEPPAYEMTTNLVLTQKEEELFQKEKNLMDAQQELYEREKKLADREAAFIGRSKALDYKEKSIENGRYYAPVGAAPAPAPVPAPAHVRRVEPPAPYAAYQQQDFVARPQPGYENGEDFVDLNNYQEQPSNVQGQSGYIILQHPIQRDLVRCPLTDDVCLEAYERLGYVRAANLSRFTAQDELDIAGSYPTGANGQWRENNNIPRW